ncbi:hypothetical protein U0355_01280 [Salimicrobium sp. PL1-032A]|uniref:hypothetical protein n=1 Tax=Salimicrobium sp. PL1-032A TaxID=3095364 RepID=UPI00326146BE
MNQKPGGQQLQGIWLSRIGYHSRFSTSNAGELAYKFQFAIFYSFVCILINHYFALNILYSYDSFRIPLSLGKYNNLEEISLIWKYFLRLANEYDHKGQLSVSVVASFLAIIQV